MEKAVVCMKRLDTEESRKIHYSADMQALEQYYDRQFELIKKGNTDLVTLELVPCRVCFAVQWIIKRDISLRGFNGFFISHGIFS